MSFFILCTQYANKSVLSMVYLGATHTTKAHGGHNIYLAMYVVLSLSIVILSIVWHRHL